MASEQLDCRGLQCPAPVARCRDLLASENPDKICVIVDNEAALENVRRFLERKAYAVTVAQAEPGIWHIDGVKSGDAQAQAQPEPDQGKTLVLITSDCMGRGDDALGAKLMESFLGSLPELGSALWRIVLLNGGVRLAARDGIALDHLRKLAQNGVSILVCGTCLMHYDLLEARKIGETTNMMDIMTSLALAQKIIRP